MQPTKKNKILPRWCLFCILGRRMHTSQALMEMNKKILYFLKERTNTRYQTLQNNLGDLGSSQNLECRHKKHCKTQNTILVVLIITSRDYPFCTEVSRPRNREGSYSFRWDKYEGLPKGADPKSRVSKAARPGVVKAESSSAVRVIKSIQEHLNVQGSGVAGIVVLSSQTLGSICLRVKESVCVREREREHPNKWLSLPHLCTERQTASATFPAKGKNWRRWLSSFIMHKYLTCLVVADGLRAGNPKPSWKQ